VNKDSTIKVFSAELVHDKLDIKEIQLEGKKKMTWKEFENGYLVKK
jgi:methionyl-tRNA formyltransferase